MTEAELRQRKIKYLVKHSFIWPSSSVRLHHAHRCLGHLRDGVVLDGPDLRQGLLEGFRAAHLPHQLVRHVGLLTNEVLRVVNAATIQIINGIINARMLCINLVDRLNAACDTRGEYCFLLAITHVIYTCYTCEITCSNQCCTGS